MMMRIPTARSSEMAELQGVVLRTGNDGLIRDEAPSSQTVNLYTNTRGKGRQDCNRHLLRPDFQCSAQ